MPTLTGPTTLYTLAETAINVLVNGAAYTTPANAIRADIELFVALVNTATPLSPPNSITIQGCDDATADEKWVDLASFSTGTTTALTTTLSTTIAAGGTPTATLAGSGTFGARTTLVYLRDSNVLGEWVRAQSHTGTTLTVPSPGIMLAHTSGINLYDQAQRFYCSLDISCIKRLRVTVDNNVAATGPTLAVAAIVNTYTA